MRNGSSNGSEPVNLRGNLPSEVRNRCARSLLSEPLNHPVITRTQLDIHRYICSAWFNFPRRAAAPACRELRPAVSYSSARRVSPFCLWGFERFSLGPLVRLGRGAFSALSSGKELGFEVKRLESPADPACAG